MAFFKVENVSLQSDMNNRNFNSKGICFTFFNKTAHIGFSVSLYDSWSQAKRYFKTFLHAGNSFHFFNRF